MALAKLHSLTHLDEERGDLGVVMLEGGGIGHAEVRLLHVQFSRRHVVVLRVPPPG